MCAGEKSQWSWVREGHCVSFHILHSATSGSVWPTQPRSWSPVSPDVSSRPPAPTPRESLEPCPLQGLSHFPSFLTHLLSPARSLPAALLLPCPGLWSWPHRVLPSLRPCCVHDHPYSLSGPLISSASLHLPSISFSLVFPKHLPRKTTSPRSNPAGCPQDGEPR